MVLYLKQRLKSFKYAFNGIIALFAHQPNLVLHFVATVCVVILGWIASISVTETIVVAICISAVWTAELFNTAIEKLCDLVTKERDERIKFIKDVSAAAVLLTATGAFIVGSIIFIPKIILWLN